MRNSFVLSVMMTVSVEGSKLSNNGIRGAVGIPGTPYLIIDNVAMGIYYFSMARIAGVVVPGLPNNITQRGNLRQVFY